MVKGEDFLYIPVPFGNTLYLFLPFVNYQKKLFPLIKTVLRYYSNHYFYSQSVFQFEHYLQDYFLYCNNSVFKLVKSFICSSEICLLVCSKKSFFVRILSIEEIIFEFDLHKLLNIISTLLV